MTHQQMHTDWLYRAYQGGLRLIVALAVNNEALCISGRELGPNLINLPIILAGLGPSAQELATKCNDDDAVTRQITDLRAMESSLNNQCAANPALGPPQGPLPGVGWLHIVTTSTQARETINRGQLAVVLGVEVDRLFNCPATTTGDGRTMTRGPCSQSDVAAGLDKYQHLGIRHYFIGHLANTVFTGMAIYGASPISWNLANHFLNGEWISVMTCSDTNISAFDFNTSGSDTVIGLGTSLFSFLGVQGIPPHYNQPLGHCIAWGLLVSGVSS